MKNKINIHGIIIGDIFQINYYGINVFFMVAKTETEKVYIVELGTKSVKINGEEHDVALGRLKYAKNPYIVKENNNITNTRYAVCPIEEKGDVYLPIDIPYESKLYKDAKKVNDYIMWGTVYAYKVEQFYGIGFEKKTEKEYLA